MSPATTLDPRAKLIGLLTVVVVTATAPRGAWLVPAASAVLLAAYALWARVPAGELWRRALPVLPLIVLLAIALPFVRSGGSSTSLGPLTVHGEGLALALDALARALVGVSGALLLTATTPVPQLLAGLRALRVPRLLVVIGSLLCRYLVVVAGDLRRTRAAMAARAYSPRHALQAGAIGRAAGSLLLRSYGRGERVQNAMAARGFSGELPLLAPLALRRTDAAFMAAFAALAVSARLAAELWL